MPDLPQQPSEADDLRWDPNRRGIDYLIERGRLDKVTPRTQTADWMGLPTDNANRTRTQPSTFRPHRRQ